MISHAFQTGKGNSSDPTTVSATYWNQLHRISVKTVAISRAITAADGMLLVTTGGSDLTLTLPDPSLFPGLLLQVNKMDSGAGRVLIVPLGGDTFDGNASGYILSEQNQKVMFASDGVSNWVSMGTN